MATQKKQHYVPKCILKNFTTNKKFYVFNVSKNSIIDNAVPYDSQCYTPYLYGKDGNIENYLKKHEDSIAPILQKIISRQELLPEEKNVIKQYIVLQYMRTEKMIDHQQNLLFNILEKILPAITSSNGIELSKNDILKYSKDYVKKFKRTDIANENIDIALKLLFSLNDLHMVVLESKNAKFVCSDHPVIFLNPFQSEFGIGLMRAGLIAIMPISPCHCIFLYDNYLYDCEFFKGSEIDVNLVKRINFMQYISCKKLLFSPNCEELKAIKSHYDKKYLTEVLKHISNILTKKGQAVGINDPLFINLQIEELEKKTNKIRNIIPKTMLHEKIDEINGIKIKGIFLPYVNNPNGSFDRNLDLNNIPLKYYCVGNDYVNVIKSYIQEREKNNDINNLVTLEE